jgi:tetratricopeptide (TPR) repeat protein
MTPEEAKEAGRKLFRDRRYREAVPLFGLAVDAFPEDESLWQELVPATHHAGQYEQAIEFSKQAIRHHISSAWLWRQLGSELTAADRLDEAEKTLRYARRFLDDSDEWLWRYLAALHQKRRDLTKEIESLETLRTLGKATSADLHQLGIAYYNRGSFAKAVECYRIPATTASDAVPLFNMGLAFAHPEVSQDVDATGAYRRVLLLNPDHGRSKRAFKLGCCLFKGFTHYATSVGLAVLCHNLVLLTRL